MKPLHKHLKKEDKEKHFRHELGLSDHYPRKGVTKAYKDGWDSIFGSKKDEQET